MRNSVSNREPSRGRPRLEVSMNAAARGDLTNDQRGQGLIGLLITIAIIAILVFGMKYFGGQKNEAQTGQDAIKQAQDAADKERQDSQTLQSQVQDLQPDLSPNTYHNVLNSAKDLPK